MRTVSDNILGAVGDTPMVRINAITRGVVRATVLAKIETFNPGNSIKDRMAIKMVEDAERAGKLKPGGTIIEGTSGNTGMGLAIVAVVKGYKCIFTTTDKQSKEKIDALKAFGAEVIVCPTNVDPEDPRMRVGRADHHRVGLPRNGKVVGEPPLAGQQPLILLAAERLPDGAELGQIRNIDRIVHLRPAVSFWRKTTNANLAFASASLPPPPPPNPPPLAGVLPIKSINSPHFSAVLILT